MHTYKDSECETIEFIYFNEKNERNTTTKYFVFKLKNIFQLQNKFEINRHQF